jgi:predicted Rossmann fold flavoprotein
MTIQNFDVIIIGAGGAGMMCGIHAARRGRSVLLIDHSEKIGRKILISGGGRCNFTNIHASPENYVSANPHFAKSALMRYRPEEFIEMVEAHRIRYHEKKLGQLFCDESAQRIVDMLVDECEEAGARFKLFCEVRKVSRKADGFFLQTSTGDYSCESLVIATGGLSIPKIGATGFGYKIAEQFGISTVPTSPALVGLNFSSHELRTLGELSGVSLDTVVTADGASFRENILFTHTGLSGPAILQASLYWHPGDPLTVDLQPELDVFDWLVRQRTERPRAHLNSVLSEILPKRFADKFAELYLTSEPLAHISDKNLQQTAELLRGWRVKPASSVGYLKAEVTRGGVDTAELSSKTMESKKVKGLYFIGEVVDVTGQLGGFNFQWAWASGFVAAQFV